jgi:type IV pilus assembly protein PilC
MKQFKYKAKDPTGNVIEGVVEAIDDQAAANLLRRKQLIIISIKPSRQLPSVLKGVKDRVSANDITNFTRQLSTMINAGLPLTEALLILRSQSSGGMQNIVGEILANVEEGEALSKAVDKHDVFSKTYVALVKSGELGGVLDQVLERLANNLERQQEFKGKVKGAMVYPVIIVVGMLIVSLIMIIFVIPRMTSLYDQFDAELPVTTKILTGFSDFMVRFWPVVLGGIAALIYGFKIYKKTEDGAMKVDRIMLKIPLVGELQKQIILAEITRTLSLMTASGVSILEGLAITSSVVGNKVMKEALDDCVNMVEKGFPVAFAFSKHPDAFPFILSQMIAVGEETGKMDEVLGKVSHVFEVESEQKLKALTAAIEPIILIVIGVGVAFLVVSIVLPIYNLTTQI